MWQELLAVMGVEEQQLREWEGGDCSSTCTLGVAKCLFFCRKLRSACFPHSRAHKKVKATEAAEGMNEEVGEGREGGEEGEGDRNERELVGKGVWGFLVLENQHKPRNGTW